MNKSAIAKAIIAKHKPSYEGGTIYVDTADTAKLIRATLADAFPATKFWVRMDRFAGGSSVDVYFDAKAPGAPDRRVVQDLVDRFGGARFDGMIDMQYEADSWLTTSGSVTFAGTRGTEGSRGTAAAVENPPPAVGAVRVQFHAWLHVNDYKPYGAA